MKSEWVYVDSSVICAAIFGDHDMTLLSKLVRQKTKLISAYLLEAEVLSAAVREKADIQETKSQLSKISFVKSSTLLVQLERVFTMGYLRGADAFHVATALWLAGSHKELEFFSFDENQVKVAKTLGLSTI